MHVMVRLHKHGATGNTSNRRLAASDHNTASQTSGVAVPPALLLLSMYPGLPRQEQCLVYGGRLLSNLRTLGSYNISKGATIPLSARLRGGASINGIKFVDVSNPYNLTRIQWSNNAPEWRGAAPGLCIEGVCNNSTCKANGNLVIFNAGYTHFDLPYEVASDRCKCPTCKKSITPVTCALNR